MSEVANVLERFRRAPEVVALIMTGVFGDEIDFQTAPDKWSIRQIARHLADSEMVAAYRFRIVIAEDNPAIPYYDEAAWASRLDYDKRKPASSLQHFRLLRADNYELLKDLAPETFQRKGTHAKLGAMTLMQLVELYADHAESHAKQLQTVREAYKQAKAKK